MDFYHFSNRQMRYGVGVLTLFMLFFCQVINAQDSPFFKKYPNKVLLKNTGISLLNSTSQIESFELFRLLEPKQDILLTRSYRERSFKAFNYDELAFFCKIDVQLEKATKFPVKFRIGEVQYVDQLEGKY